MLLQGWASGAQKYMKGMMKTLNMYIFCVKKDFKKTQNTKSGLRLFFISLIMFLMDRDKNKKLVNNNKVYILCV